MIRIRFVREHGLASGTICWFTESTYAHAGVYYRRGGKLFELGARDSKDGAKAPGVQIRPADYAEFTRVMVLRFYEHPEQYTRFWDFLDDQVGKPYDWKAIAGMAMNRNWRDPHRWFCSELVAAALEEAGIIPRLTTVVHRITPGTLACICQAAGARIEQEKPAA